MQQANYPLKARNSFALAANCKELVCIDSLKQLELFAQNLPVNFYILGAGSNSLFVDNYDGTIVCPEFKGITVTETDTCYSLEVGSGINWHQLVCYCLTNNMPGLENLALIPGNCGAAPIQNIGAYGLEFADVCGYVKWFDFASGKVQTLTAQQCEFTYRESIFKGKLKNKGVVIAIGIILAKKWQPILGYAGLNELGAEPIPQQVFDCVVNIRQSKLPDPDILPNVGSFFKNPIVSEDLYQILKAKQATMPAYPLSNSLVKLAAGWLIQECGLKGKNIGGAAVHTLQALVLVNLGNASGGDVVKLAKFVQQAVFNKFNVMLEPEVRLIARHGEIKLEDIQ